MKVIFLDIDGVLNDKEYFIKNHDHIKYFFKNTTYNKDDVDLLVERQMMDIDEKKLLLLKRIIDETQANVVITSSWKRLYYFPQLIERFTALGIPVIGYTEDDAIDRGVGIKKYIGEHNVTDYIILDDDIFPDYDEKLLAKLVKTSFYEGGLQEKHVDELVKRLKKEKK